ncbi:MAG TPA: trehalose-6-phosphate synthase [Candidatus Saccharimonadales bacterium]|nr:trehalose-6-phosphate synthase [Candidatus Saccharimonadales bacterium]
MRGKVILVANRLPIKIVEQAGAVVLERSIGGVATALDAVAQTYNPLWVGWTGLAKHLPAATLQSLLPPNLVPVQAGAALVTQYYDHIANQVLWPVLHEYAPTHRATSTDWKGYHEIAGRFAEAIARVVQPGDVIWSHDFHLLLLPAALRAQGITNKVGHFLHTPFPPAEYLLPLDHCAELLASLAQVDVLGLQTQRDVENFHSLVRLSKGRLPPRVGAFPIGIDYHAYRHAGMQPDVQRFAATYKREAAGKRIILSISRRDYTKGILNQLRAVERLLATTRQPEQFVYRLVVAPSRENVRANAQLQHDIETTVAGINQRWSRAGWQPVEYSYENLSFAQMTAWYLCAEIMLLAPMLDGMNLIAKEYVATRQAEPGVLVLSEAAGAAAQLRDALLINPTDIDATANALMQATAMAPAEKTKRWHRLQQVVQTEDVYHWADAFITAVRKQSRQPS